MAHQSLKTRTMNIPANINKVLSKIEDTSNPISIFVYGSRANNEARENSDWEVGVLYEEDKKWSRSELAKIHDIENLNIYPFDIEKLKKYEIDTPFPAKIYIKDLVEGSETVIGKNVLEELNSPDITAADLLETTSFETGYALGALIALRDGAEIAASIMFSKSVFFGLRNLIIMEKGTYPSSFTEIYKQADELNLEDKYKELVKTAMKVRNGDYPSYQQIFTNISLQNQMIRKRILETYPDLKTIVIKGDN